MKRMYDYSISGFLLERSIFWTIIVWINTVPGVFFSSAIEWLFWKILWILSWLLIYIFIVWKSYKSIPNKVFRKSLYLAYMFKSLMVLIFLSFYVELFIWAFSIWLSERIMSLLWFTLTHLPDSLYFQTDFPNIFTYITTIIHWLVLSIWTLILWAIFYVITKVFTKESSVKNNF
jgi:hypothetical protein